MKTNMNFVLKIQSSLLSCLIINLSVSAHATEKLNPSDPQTPVSMVRLNQVRENQQQDFDISGLPAISKDGKSLALPMVDNDGGRGWVNLRVEFPSISGSSKHPDFLVLGADELTKTDGDIKDEVLSIVNKRLGKLNQILKEDGYHPFQDKAKHLELKHGEKSRRLQGDGYTIVLEGLWLKVKKNKTMLGQKKIKPLSRQDYCRDSNQEILKEAYLYKDFSLVVLGYTGNDTCWEPSDKWFVIPLTKSQT